jgi:hypothetical protein
MAEGSDIEQPFHTNEPYRLRAMVSAYPTVADLVQELKRSEAVTLAMAATMPEQTTRHKHIYYQIGTYLIGFADHTREHFGEIRRLVEAARAQ